MVIRCAGLANNAENRPVDERSDAVLPCTDRSHMRRLPPKISLPFFGRKSSSSTLLQEPHAEVRIACAIVVQSVTVTSCIYHNCFHCSWVEICDKRRNKFYDIVFWASVESLKTALLCVLLIINYILN